MKSERKDARGVERNNLMDSQPRVFKSGGHGTITFGSSALAKQNRKSSKQHHSQSLEKVQKNKKEEEKIKPSSSQDKHDLNETVPHDHVQQIKNEIKQSCNKKMQKKHDVVEAEENKQGPLQLIEEEKKEEVQPRGNLGKIVERSEEGES